jgi:hypothetical protein
VKHLQVTGSEDDLPPVPAGVVGAGADADITGSTDIAAPQRPQEDGWSSEDWLAYRDERAAIAEHDGKLPRPQAEVRAFQSCIAEWLDQHPAFSSPEAGCACLWCHRPDDSLLPVGLGSGPERTWLHRDCIPTWRSARMDAAAEALRAMGITSKGSPARTAHEVPDAQRHLQIGSCPSPCTMPALPTLEGDISASYRRADGATMQGREAQQGRPATGARPNRVRCEPGWASDAD